MEAHFFEIAVIVACASVLAWLAALTRQPIIMAYVLCGVVAGPWGLRLVEDVELVNTISRIGVTLLLFLAGIVLHPQRLLQLFRTAAVVTVGCCVFSGLLIFGLLKAYGVPTGESVFASLALMFSSTILVVKLLPTTTLHQRHMGAVCIAVLIAQDLLAVFVLLMVRGGGATLFQWGLLLPIKACALVLLALGFEQFVLRRMMMQSERYHEVLYMLCLGWCLGMAMLAARLGLSQEVGAFIAGVVLARSPLARVLSTELKPIRDFFLMFFFFVLGAQLDLFIAKTVWWPALLAAVLILLSRPFVLSVLFRAMGETPAFSREVGVRLGQGSEFGMIIAVAAYQYGRVSLDTSQLIQLAVIFSMIVSSYVVVVRYPSPLGVRRGLKQD